MLTRTLEPEAMDSLDEARAYDSMNHGEVNRRFVDDFLAAAARWQGFDSVRAADYASVEPRVLDLGAGTARIPIELCLRLAFARVTAIDSSAAMLALAKQNVAQAGLTERIGLELADAKHLPFAGDSFNAVISNSIIHHVPKPLSVLAEAVRVASPGGLIFMRDLIRPENAAEVDRIVAQYAHGETESAQALFHASLRAALTLSEVRAMVAELGFPQDDVIATSDRHWTWSTTRTRGYADAKPRSATRSLIF